MRLTELLELSATLLASLGGGSLIVFGFSNWLGHVWADRLMSRERKQHEEELEKLRSQLRTESEQSIADVRTWLEIQKETHLKHHGDKLNIYRAAIDIVAEMLHELELVSAGIKPTISPEVFERFSQRRLQAYGYLAMLAPQDVMDKFDALIDMLLDVLHDGKKVTFKEIRGLAIALLNEIRADLGIAGDQIKYRGRR